jgi:hypothetical protein
MIQLTRIGGAKVLVNEATCIFQEKGDCTIVRVKDFKESFPVKESLDQIQMRLNPLRNLYAAYDGARAHHHQAVCPPMAGRDSLSQIFGVIV